MPVHWCHSGQSGRPRPGEYAHEHSLNLIIGVMGGKNTARSQSVPDLLEPGVAPDAGKRLAGERAQVEAATFEREGERLGEGSHLLGNPMAVGMDAMIDVSDSQLEPVEILGTDQQVQEHNRIRTPGGGHDGSSGVQTEVSQVTAESLDEGHGLKIT
jgi:hypothetical protein